MRQAQQNQRDVLDQTWNRMLDVNPSPSPAGPVSTVRVRIIGTATEADTTSTPVNFGKTKRYPSVGDRVPQPSHTHDERDWRVLSARDVTFLSDADEPAEEPLAFASTVPALTYEDLGIEESGVHAIDHRLRLTLDPRDSAALQAPLRERTHTENQTTTLRLKAQRRPASESAWQRWERQSPFITIGTAATFCFISALLVSMLAP